MIGTDFSVGPVRVRLEIVPIVFGLALFASIELGVAFFLTILLHEAAHAGVARLFGVEGAPLTLQVTGGGSYVRTVSSKAKRVVVLLAGPLASAAVALGALTVRVVWTEPPSIVAFASALYRASAVWAVYQLAPFPPLDSGQVLRILLAPRMVSATVAWRIGWGLGFLFALVWVLLDVRSAEPVILLTGIALILGRGEAGYVRHLDAYTAWENGQHAKVLKIVRKVPDYLDKTDRATLLELGVFAAMEMGDDAAVEELAQKLPAYRPVVMKAAEWLLLRDRAFGAKLSQHAIDALDHDVMKPRADELERFADLAFRHAVFEAKALRFESALGLLERSVALGFKDADRIRADGDLRPLAAHPRLVALLVSLEAPGEKAPN